MTDTGVLVQEGLLRVTLSKGPTSTDLREVAGNWDTFDGGSVRAPSKAYRPGGGGDEVLSVGFPSVEEITISRGYRAGRDAALEAELLAEVGSYCAVKKEVLDPATKAPVTGTQRVYSGRITGVTTPRARSDGGEEVAMLSVTIGVEGLPS